MNIKVITQKGLKSVSVLYFKIVSSIAFIPAVVALLFLILSLVMVQFDYSDAGKAIKANAHWLTLKDASTARSIISTITGGIISLTVFSFSMVMILLNQAASQMSNRILDKLIGNRFQQIVLGFYIGTIVYALFLMSTIRDIDSGVYVPAISTYLLISFTVIDIFLFIYFLHYVTQSVKYETIIHQISDTTQRALEKNWQFSTVTQTCTLTASGLNLPANKSGVYQGFMEKPLLALCKRENLILSIDVPTGTSLIEGTPFIRFLNVQSVSRDVKDQINGTINIHGGQSIANNYFYGLRQLTEVALKALSPGINDPGTAILSLQALGQLLAFRALHYPGNTLQDDEKTTRIFIRERTFEEIFEDCIFPIWDYGKKDRMLINALHHVLSQLNQSTPRAVIKNLLAQVEKSKTQMD
ncbi:DUF2254 domain-containing protein [Pedobacter endophyticus]|uniref:DUF2254 domain-containing protein n=1 Tax=Pedobacter endophyticus TaxID=2789740 RepID=A0A7S9L1U7_9SPHI|nr:DUF2254 family protein [Pedobacter endophyticus]QPH40888.1 DUF2254 domain-containing protein [Pedobacter endophyticus]